MLRADLCHITNRGSPLNVYTGATGSPGHQLSLKHVLSTEESKDHVVLQSLKKRRMDTPPTARVVEGQWGQTLVTGETPATLTHPRPRGKSKKKGKPRVPRQHVPDSWQSTSSPLIAKAILSWKKSPKGPKGKRPPTVIIRGLADVKNTRGKSGRGVEGLL